MKTNLLQKSFSLLFYSFRINSEWLEATNLIPDEQTIWQKSPLRVKEQYLFPYVQDYFNHNAEKQAADSQDFDESQCIIFELKKSLKKTRANCSAEKLFTTRLVLKTKNQNYSFGFYEGLKRSILSPKIIIVPQSNVGFLSFSLSLEGEEIALQELIDFNYAIRSLATPSKTAPKVISRFETLHPQFQQIFTAVSKTTDTENYAFTFKQFIDFLLDDFEANIIKALSPKHFHIFTFTQTENSLPSTDLNHALFRLSRVYNNQYHPPFDNFRDNPEAVQTFRDVFMAISQEGGTILVNSDGFQKVAFLNNYVDKVVKNRYVWIYILAYLQRITLINTATTINDLLREHDNDIEVVSKTVKQLSKIQIRSMFSEISHIQMHNTFYTLCRNNFKIPALFQELKNEIFDLNLIVQQDFELNRIAQEKEERAREIRKEELRLETEAKQAKFEKRLNFILFGLGVLTFVSVWKDFTDLLQNGLNRSEWISLLQLSGLVLIILVVVYIFGRIMKKE